jgi:hypothetical protein
MGRLCGDRRSRALAMIRSRLMSCAPRAHAAPPQRLQSPRLRRSQRLHPPPNTELIVARGARKARRKDKTYLTVHKALPILVSKGPSNSCRHRSEPVPLAGENGRVLSAMSTSARMCTTYRRKVCHRHRAEPAGNGQMKSACLSRPNGTADRSRGGRSPTPSPPRPPPSS